MDTKTAERPKSEKPQNADLLLCSDLYKNAALHAEACTRLIGYLVRDGEKPQKDTDPKTVPLKEELTAMMNCFSGYAARAVERLHILGAPPAHLSMLDRMPAEVGITVQAMADHTPSALAELMISQLEIGSVDMTRALHSCTADGCSAETAEIADALIAYTGHCSDLLESYL